MSVFLHLCVCASVHISVLVFGEGSIWVWGLLACRSAGDYFLCLYISGAVCLLLWMWVDPLCLSVCLSMSTCESACQFLFAVFARLCVFGGLCFFMTVCAYAWPVMWVYLHKGLCIHRVCYGLNCILPPKNQIHMLES